MSQPLNNNDYQSIDFLKDKKFVIPTYQRGYKWRKKDVENLINDISEINENEEKYCLQPIVVAKDGTSYILVDGQQRLTTIWLIYTWAKNNNIDNIDPTFSIEYKEGRGDSNDFLKKYYDENIINDEKTCDIYYYWEAIKTISENNEKLTKFFENLKNKVCFIWYEIDKEEGPSKFEKLNSCKIGLTNAELVKALILTKADESTRSRIANEWDSMEYSLQDNAFFSFLTPSDSSYQKEYNRIELILDLYTEVTKSDRERDEYATFNKIIINVQQNQISDNVWQEICNVYRRIESWYYDNDNFLYNMIGFLTQVEDRNILLKLWIESKNISIAEFKKYVCTKVKEHIPNDVSTLVYKSQETFKTLLLFNILSMMSIKCTACGERKYFFYDKFHFDLFHKQKWDKEHIHATASETLKSKQEWVMWMRDIIPEWNEVVGRIKMDEGEKECINTWLKKASELSEGQINTLDSNISDTSLQSLTKEIFSKLYNTIIKTMEGNDNNLENLKQNSIGNLVLLDRGTNRSYKAAPFSTKRRFILSRIKQGVFVPIGTQYVFQKLYTKYPNYYKWDKSEDRENYIKAIDDVLSKLK